MPGPRGGGDAGRGRCLGGASPRRQPHPGHRAHEASVCAELLLGFFVHMARREARGCEGSMASDLFFALRMAARRCSQHYMHPAAHDSD